MESVDNEKKGGGNADFSDVQLKRKTLCEGGNDQNEKRVMRGEERLSGESSPISEKQSELKEDKEDSTIKKCQHMEALGGLEKVAEAGEVAGCIDVDGKKKKLFCAKSDQEKKRMKRGDKMTGDESTEDRKKIVMETLRRLFPDDLNLINIWKRRKIGLSVRSNSSLNPKIPMRKVASRHCRPVQGQEKIGWRSRSSYGCFLSAWKVPTPYIRIHC
jgi:hypothetical protein